jgi:hypothetical protein
LYQYLYSPYHHRNRQRQPRMPLKFQEQIT